MAEKRGIVVDAKRGAPDGAGMPDGAATAAPQDGSAVSSRGQRTGPVESPVESPVEKSVEKPASVSRGAPNQNPDVGSNPDPDPDPEPGPAKDAGSAHRADAGAVAAGFDLLVRHGLVSLVRADAGLTIVARQGRGAAQVAIGAPLCLALPPLFGLDSDIQALATAPPEARLIVNNVSVMNQAGVPERYDFAVVYDHAADEFVVAIIEALAAAAGAIAHEQGLRELLHLERQVAAQAREIEAANQLLRRTNDDLVNFTRIISHDLKAPMRAIRYSADDIEAALPAAEAGGPIDALEELRRHAGRMSRMVSDLLSYSRLEDKAAAAEPVDCRALVAAISASLPRPAGLKIKLAGDWPTVHTAKALLDVVIRNLIDNAIKHHDRHVGEIQVTADADAEQLVIAVMDDGPGIPPRHREAVLRPFVRLNKVATNGTGMGLSMVARLVADQGGHIDIAGRPDGRRGVCIKIAWPLTNMAL